jgi:hypothetical protein
MTAFHNVHYTTFISYQIFDCYKLNVTIQPYVNFFDFVIPESINCGEATEFIDIWDPEATKAIYILMWPLDDPG